MHLEGIENKVDNLKLLEEHLNNVAITQTVNGKISHVASYETLLALCFVGGTINFIDFRSKSESPVNNVMTSVRIIRKLYFLIS